MKFLTKINRNYILLFAIILTAVTVAGYLILQVIIREETKETLLGKEYLIKKQILETGEISDIYPIIEVDTIAADSIINSSFKKVFINNEIEDESEPFLEYSNQINIKGLNYSVKIRQSLFENEDLVIGLALFIFILLLSAFAISFFITKKMNKTIWVDFEQNLREIENFSFNEKRKVNLIKSDIDEFDRLNLVINNLTEKLEADYLSLKESTENASHEIQTPISIILLNLEELLQQELSEETFKKIITSINSAKRLSSLNQSLILLTKIDNKQFVTDKIIIINDLVKGKLQEFESLFEIKNLKIEVQSEKDFTLKINEQLAELLINNLLSNAVNHNFPDGLIRISINETCIKICNTGKPNSLNDETVFNRFAKGDSTSFGLGLAIVKNICKTHNLEIHYFKNGLHCFVINHKA